MTDHTDHPVDPNALQEAVARADRNGIAVRKVTSLHGPEAVAVYFTIRSTRDDRATVRIVDPLPEAVRDHEVEFHPKYDPVNWTRAEDSVVYAATVPPDGNRTTVYGVVIDDPEQLELFEVDPTVEITSTEPAEAEVGAFSFGAGGGTSDSSGGGEWSSSASVSNAIVEAEPDRDPTADSSEESTVAALVSEVRRRNLTEPERRALRRALGFDDDGDDEPLASLREEVETLRDEVASADRQAADVDRLESRLESLSTTLDDRYAALSAELDELRRAVETGARWRDQLRESIEFEPDPAATDREDGSDSERRHSEL